MQKKQANPTKSTPFLMPKQRRHTKTFSSSEVTTNSPLGEEYSALTHAHALCFLLHCMQNPPDLFPHSLY